jgi:hypothetical protein
VVLLYWTERFIGAICEKWTESFDTAFDLFSPCYPRRAFLPAKLRRDRKLSVLTDFWTDFTTIPSFVRALLLRRQSQPTITIAD